MNGARLKVQMAFGKIKAYTAMFVVKFGLKTEIQRVLMLVVGKRILGM